VQIREYINTDWPSVWPIFQEVVAAADSIAYDPGWSSERAQDVWVVGPPGHTVVACDGPRVLGTAHMGPNRPGPGSHVSTATFMVASDARRRGVGRALGAAASRYPGDAALRVRTLGCTWTRRDNT
jgi:GNAT superfamily N-acetyltransferase